MGGKEDKKQFKKNVKNQDNKELIGCPDFGKLYKNMADSITGGVWVAKKNDIICYANKGMSKIAGIPVKDFLGINVVKGFSEDTLKFFRPYYLKAKKTKKKIKYEAVPVVTPNKKLTYQSGWLIPVVKNKELEGIICTVDDVTKEEEYKQKLEESKKTYEQFFNIISGGVVVYHPIKDGKDFVIKDVNKAGEKLTKVKKKNILGKRAEVVYPGIKEMGLFDILIKTYKTGQSHYHPITQYKDKKFNMFFENYVYKLPSGDVVAVFYDKTKEIELEEKRKKQNIFLHKIMDSLPYPFYVIKANNYEIKAANSIARQKMGSLKSAKCFEVSHRRNSPCKGHHPCPLEIVKKTNKPAIVEHIHFDKEGNERLVEVHGYPIFNKNNELVEMIEYSIDITDKRKVEDDLKKHLADTENINSLMINRELKMIELKEEIKKLKKKK
jgi:PAS domain S-box-containing protein